MTGPSTELVKAKHRLGHGQEECCEAEQGAGSDQGNYRAGRNGAWNITRWRAKARSGSSTERGATEPSTGHGKVEQGAGRENLEHVMCQDW